MDESDTSSKRKETMDNTDTTDVSRVETRESEPPESRGSNAVEMPAGSEETAQAEVAEGQIDAVGEARQEAERLRNQMLRIAADFENYRKRARRDADDAARRSREDFLRELLPVFDNLERAVAHAEQATDARAVADGVKIVLRQFLDTLGKLGVSRVKAVGVAFDPNVHEAIQQVPTDEQPPGTVVAEVQPGYLWDERLVRAAMVVVAKASKTGEPPGPSFSAN